MSFVRERLPDPLSYFADHEGMRLHGGGAWRGAHCPFHGGGEHKATLRINAKSGAWVCMACGVKGGDVVGYEMERYGVDFVAAAKALGAWDQAAPAGNSRQKPLSFSPLAALQVLRDAALLVAVAACNVRQGDTLTDSDHARLVEVAAEIMLIVDEVAP